MPYNNIYVDFNITYCCKIRKRCISEIRITKWFSLSIGMNFIKRKEHLKALSCLPQGKMYSHCKNYCLHVETTPDRVSGNSGKSCEVSRYSSAVVSHDFTSPTLVWRNLGIEEVKNKSVAQWINTTFPTKQAWTDSKLLKFWASVFLFNITLNFCPRTSLID